MWLADQRERLARVHVPTLIICGEEDKPTPSALSEALHRLIPKSELKMIAHAGHLTNLERPVEFDAVVAAFIEPLE